MKVIDSIEKLARETDKLKRQNQSIGFVPTMGALHNGHLSLVEMAGNQNDLVIVSIFVNPIQFNNPDDLRNYPRDIESDLNILSGTACKIVFVPTENEIYPDENSKKGKFDFGYISSVMEGKYRPGHFDGVATVVKRLFEIVRPDRAYFGQKDIQQFLIIDNLNRNYLSNLNIDVIKCPIIREIDGLAMSSRNVLLNSSQRKSAVLISQSLFEAQKKYSSYKPDEIKSLIINKINADPNLKVEYLELVSEPDLKGVSEWDDSKRILACIAVQVGSVRLIDNIYFN